MRLKANKFHNSTLLKILHNPKYGKKKKKKSNIVIVANLSLVDNVSEIHRNFVIVRALINESIIVSHSIDCL